jgi:hypothetical protein
MEPNRPLPIRIPYPDTPELHLRIILGGCTLTLAPGFGNAWVTGSYFDPKDLAPLEVARMGNHTQITVGDVLRDLIQPRFRSRLHLSFGRRRPFSLSIVTGDIDTHFELGCLPLSALEINGGNGRQEINFSCSNPQAMQAMKFTASAGSIHIQNIANANAAEVRVGGDVDRCQLDFGGELRRNTEVQIGMSVSNVALTIPAETAARINSRRLLGRCPAASFVYRENAYWNQPAGNQQTPLLSIRSVTALGALSVQSV